MLPGPFLERRLTWPPSNSRADRSYGVRTDVNSGGRTAASARYGGTALSFSASAMAGALPIGRYPVPEIHHRVRPAREWDVELAAICRRALSDNPGLRQASAKEFAEDPEEVFSEFPETRERRNRLITWAAALSAAWSLLYVVAEFLPPGHLS